MFTKASKHSKIVIFSWDVTSMCVHISIYYLFTVHNWILLLLLLHTHRLKIVYHMWQSRVEVEDYSVMYFDCIAAFKAPYCWTSVKGRAHTCFVDAWIYVLRRLVSYSLIYNVRMSPALNRSLAIRCFKHRDEVEIHDGIIDFYMGLSHMYVRFFFFFAKIMKWWSRKQFVLERNVLSSHHCCSHWWTKNLLDLRPSMSLNNVS